MKKLLSVLMALAMLLTASMPVCAEEEVILAGKVVTVVEKMADAFGKADWKALSDLSVDAEIILNGAAGTVLSRKASETGNVLTIAQKGVYHVTGTGENVQILVNDESKNGNITLILDNVTMTHDSAPMILVESADKVILWVKGDSRLDLTAKDGTYDAAVYARDTLTVTGTGTLTLASAGDGIICKDNYRQTGAELAITAEEAGLDVNDSVRIGGGTLAIVSGKDGIHLANSDLDSWYYQEAGTVSITSRQDGIAVSGSGDSFTGFVTLYGGTLQVVAGAGTVHTWNADVSTKGIKCQGDIYIGGVMLDVSSTDDALHSDACVSVTDGTLTLSSEDDGIHADSILSISGGSVLVSESYEGLEAYEINLSGGDIRVYASDDGLNAAGGSDTTSAETNPWARWSRNESASVGVIRVSGGTVYVNAKGDGLDSNGSLYVTGGLVIVEGPTDSGNGALDRGDGAGSVASITGGTVLAIGSTGMAVNFDSGTQCAALVAVSGSAGDVISVDDGSGFTFTATKDFDCAVYSSPSLAQGNTYTLTAGSQSALLDFTAGLYCNTVGGGWGGRGGPGGHGGHGGPGGPGGPGGIPGRGR